VTLGSHILDTTITVKRSTLDHDSGGSPRSLWADHLANVEARVHQVGGFESVRGGGESARRTWMVFTNIHDIAGDDRIEWVDYMIPDQPRTRTLDIQSVVNAHGRGHHLEIECEETDA